MADHLTREELEAGLPEILSSPKNTGTLEAITIRPEKGERRELRSCDISLAGGTHGDHWAKGCWMSTDDGEPHPDVQICIMNSRCIDHIAQDRSRWALAGDNLFVDLDLSPENLPAGQRLSLGSAILEITEVRHAGCASFAERYGREAVVFVNITGKKQRLRGIYARVVQDGTIGVGDKLVKL